MTPQSHFTVVGAIATGREAGLRDLLAMLNFAPGRVNPCNEIVPFGRLECLHVARFVIVDDYAFSELQAHGLPHPAVSHYLAFIGDCDGPLRDFLRDLSENAGDGLRRVFSHCEGFETGADLVEWMLAQNQPAAASYVNRVGRTVLQVREESALQRALSAKVKRGNGVERTDARRARRELVSYIEEEVRAGRLRLTAPARTPLAWWLSNMTHAVAVPVIGLLASPFLVLLSPLIVYVLRTREKTDPELVTRPDARALAALQQLEDHDVSNQFSAVGAVKRGIFRRWLLAVLLAGLDYATRHIFRRGYLTRVQTIHFAHWAFLDGKTRLIFASNYDGSLESYMDDFINKVAWGLNLVFSNGFGYPHTDWLVKGGARKEQQFKYYLRRHQQPTEVWYKAYPGLTVIDIERNRRIRQGLERAETSEADARAWLRLL